MTYGDDPFTRRFKANELRGTYFWGLQVHYGALSVVITLEKIRSLKGICLHRKQHILLPSAYKEGEKAHPHGF